LRGVTIAMFVVSLCFILAGLVWWAGAYPQISTAPAVVVVPQLIVAVLFGGFGIVTCTASAVGLAVMNMLAEPRAAPFAASTIAPPSTTWPPAGSDAVAHFLAGEPIGVRRD
jgi:hypothetical protein